MADDFLHAYEEHVWDVYGYFAYRALRPSDAEDLTQLTFERALRAWDRFDPQRASVKTWLLAIARNAYIDFRRRDRSWRQASISAGEVAETELPTHAGPEERLGLSPELATAIRHLSHREREVIALRFGADMRGPEIAEFLGITVANAQQLLSRGLRRMRGELERVPVERPQADARASRERRV